MSWPFIIPLIVYVGSWAICLLMLYVVPHKRDPESATTWLIFCFFLPYIAMFTFMLIGNSKLSPTRRARQNQLDAFNAHKIAADVTLPALAAHIRQELPPHQQQVATLVERLGGMPVMGGNIVELISDYAGTIARIAADIDRAQQYVHLLYYIFADDASGRQIAEAVCRASARGVRCRVLYDRLGNHAYLGKLASTLKDAGVEVYPVLPITLFGAERQRFDLRNHRKIAIIDGQVAYTGSQNLTNPTFKPGIEYEELVARVQGPVIMEFGGIFLGDWFSETNTHIPIKDQPRLASLLPPPGSTPCQVLPSGPAYSTDNIPLVFATLLYLAQRRIVLTTPYFVPDASLLRAMENAALRGVDVHLIVSEQGDQFVVSRAQRSYYEEMLDAGVHIHAVRSPTFVHAKHLSIDDDMSVVGSSNFDVRSFRLDLEVVLLSYSAAVVAEQRAVEASYLARADQLTLAQWQNRPRGRQFVENVCRLVSSLL